MSDLQADLETITRARIDGAVRVAIAETEARRDAAFIEFIDEIIPKIVAETEARIAERLKGLEVEYMEAARLRYGSLSDADARDGIIDAGDVLDLIQELQPQSDSVNEIPVALDKAQKIRHEINKRYSVVSLPISCNHCSVLLDGDIIQWLEVKKSRKDDSLVTVAYCPVCKKVIDKHKRDSVNDGRGEV